MYVDFYLECRFYAKNGNKYDYIKEWATQKLKSKKKDYIREK